MRIAITSEGEALQSAVDPRFGRAKYFVVVDTEMNVTAVIYNGANVNAAQGAGIKAGKRVSELGVQALITGNVGPKAFEILREGNVAVYTGATGTVADAIEQFRAGNLKLAESANVEGHW
ncbi:MAG: dinitrogenase iron-molybdenum cofactor biosynthesis protein [Acidobacteria bacterium]|nr:MAG: dinitrogenase iron-molybdenum cofactor biosynthesis protein [Acidobacteriota bacterium]